MDYCNECNTRTQIIYDNTTGDTVCSDCGLVLEAHGIDETSEWRVFSDDFGKDESAVRVGGPANPLLTNGSLITIISQPNKQMQNKEMQSKRVGLPDPDAPLIKAFKTIVRMCDQLNIVTTVKDRASEIFKKVVDSKSSLKGKNQEAILAACLYTACQEQVLSRTVKEICSVASGVTKKEFGRAKKYIDDVMGEQSKQMGPVRPGDLMKRFCYNLSTTQNVIKAAQEAATQSEELDIRRTPSSLAAALIYMVTQLSQDKYQLKDIADCTGVAPGTIKNTYKDIHPFASRLIPTWYAEGEQLSKLCNPRSVIV